MAASFCGSTPSATVKQCSGKDNHDRLMALYHTGTDVKRHLLQYYLSQNKLDLAGFLYGKYQLLPPDYLKRALPTKNFQLLDLGIYTIDALLSDQCFDLFWDSCLDKVETSLENILNRYKELLYRLYKTSGRDNQSARNERKWDFLSKKQWEYLYNSPELQEMQENDFDLSLTFPNEGITTQSFDNDMNFVLLSNLCPLYQSLQVVTTNQMKLSMIAVEHEINNEAFDEIWKLMATHLKQISSYCIGEAWYDHNLNWIKEGSFKGVKAQESRKCILESTFDNKTFLEDAEFMTRVQEELNLIKAEETKDLVSKLCDREIPVLLVKGQYEAGSYPSAIEKAARQDLESCQSVCSKQATIMETVSTSKNINVLEEQKNIDRQSYLRFVNLIQEVAKAVLVEVLKKRFPGANFGNALNGMKTRLLPFLNGYQEQLLYPDGSKYAGDLSEMDISLLYIILRNHGTIGPHQKGWGKDPEEHDNSVSANIDRIRIAKNIIVSHSSNCLLGHAEFNKRWTEIRQCCVELGGEKYEEIIDNLLTSSFNSDLEQQFAKKLENLKEMDMCNEKHCRQREELLDSVKEILVILKKEQACRERSRDTNHEEGFTPMILQIKGNNIPGKKEIEEKIGNYNNNEMHVTSVDSGSIIIRLQMSSSAFQSFGYFLTAIDKLLQQAFSSRPISEDDIVVCISLSVNMHQFTEENTERSSRKENIFDQSTDVPPNAPMVTDQKSSSTSLLYGRSGMISKPESSVELVRTTREIPLRENNPVLALRPQLFQRFKEHNEVDKESTKPSKRKRKLSEECTVGPPKTPRVTDQISSTNVTSVLYDRSGRIPKTEVSQQSSVELVSVTGDIPDRGNNTSLPFGPQKFQRLIEHNEVDKAKPANLNDNQKRWLVVGICLHSIVAPALIKYVVPILTVLYNELTLKNMIDTQTYPTHLKQYPPTKAYLNYESVNNNKATYGYRRAKYDYTIKSIVDLSKLFLQPHMAQYTGLDDTCDSSAVLGLIINIDKFPPMVMADAEDVRRNIRNPWAHCDFTQWDAVKYSDSFQLMEKLVYDLSLSPTEERKIVQEMKKWKLNGQHLLSGTTLGLELVNDIHHQTQALAQYTKLVANETDHNFMRINHVLENFDILLNTASGLEKEKKTEFLERLMSKEENPDTLFDSQKIEIEFWEEQEVVFVDTPVVNVISKILESENSVLIVGEPGIGKSMLLHYVALKLQKKIDYTIVPCTGINDILQQYKENTRQMFVLDDICGRFTVSLSDIDHWMKKEDTIQRILQKGSTKIAATCRLDIYNDKIFQESCTIFKSNIINLSLEYSREDKLTICKHYLSETSIQLLKDQNVDFTPLMCYLYSKNKIFNLANFLKCPFETYKKEWNRLKDNDPYKYFSLFLCVIYNGIMKESLFDKHSEINTVWVNFLEICGVSPRTSKNKIKTVLDSMVGTYVRKTRNEYRVIHDQMFDYMCCYVGNRSTLVRCILRYSHIRVFNQRTQLESINEQHGKFTIVIPKKYEKEYFERIKNEIQHGKLNQCFYNTQMKYEEYRTSFLKTLQSIDDKLLFAQIYQRQKLRLNRTHGDSIEIMECEDYSDYDDDDDDDTDNDSFTFYVTEGPFIKSCLRGYYDVFQYFMSKDVDIKNLNSIHTPLTAACKGENEQIVQVLIEKGSDVNQVDGMKQTPLTVACIRGNKKIVQFLIDKGCDVYQFEGIIQTPLTAACIGGNEEIVQLLISIGSEINQADVIGQTPLTAGCIRGNEKIVQILIDKGSDVNQVDGMGQTPLTTACFGGNEKIVQVLIDKGSDVNQVDGMGQTPLTTACFAGNEKIVRLLIDKLSNVYMVDGIGQTPLIAACTGGNTKIVQLLIDKEIDVHQVNSMMKTPLTTACRGGNEKIVHLLIDKGCDVNQVDLMGQTPLTAACSGGYERIIMLLIEKGSKINQYDGMGQTPMTTACIRGNEKIVQLLIDKGSGVDQVNGMMQTPLTTACNSGHEGIVKLLIDEGTDVNQGDSMGQTPLTTACKRGYEKIVHILVDNGSDVNKGDVMGQTPLIYACKRGNEKIVQSLLDKGSKVKQLDSIGQTPLTAACSVGNKKIVQLLIDKGSDVNRVDGMGQTPLTTARFGGNEEIVQLLIDIGSAINQADVVGQTPLTAGCIRGNEKIVQLLINKGSDVNQVDGMGHTPLTAACKRGNENIVKILIDKGSDVNQVDGMGQTPLTTACATGHEKIVQLLTDKGSDVKGQKTLTAACSERHEEIVQ